MRRHCAHYDVTVILKMYETQNKETREELNNGEDIDGIIYIYICVCVCVEPLHILHLEIKHKKLRIRAEYVLKLARVIYFPSDF